MSTVPEVCPAAVCETRFQPGEAPQSGGGNLSIRKAKKSKKITLG